MSPLSYARSARRARNRHETATKPPRNRHETATKPPRNRYETVTKPKPTPKGIDCAALIDHLPVVEEPPGPGICLRRSGGGSDDAHVYRNLSHRIFQHVSFLHGLAGNQGSNGRREREVEEGKGGRIRIRRRGEGKGEGKGRGV